MNEALMKELSKKKAFLFDFDGTIFSMNQDYVVMKSFVEEMGKEMTDDDFKILITSTYTSYTTNLNKLYDLNLTPEFALSEYDKGCNAFADVMQIKNFAYVDELIKKFKRKNFYIISNNEKDTILSKLRKNQIDNVFKDIVACDNISKEELYKDIKGYLGYKPQDCVLFEDSQKYLDKGKEVGFLTVGIEHRFSGKLNADYIIKAE